MLRLTWNSLQRSVGVLLLVPAFAVVLVVGGLIRLNSSGSILIRLTREGKDGARFQIYKLRTMVADADAVLERQLMENETLRQEWLEYGRLARDPRVVGNIARVARRFSVDELPQILNVVLGEMNLVGPRPLPLDVVSFMRAEHRRCRQSVLPGITGLWQVSGRSDLSIRTMGRLDCIYVRRRTTLLDLAILLRTVCVVLRGRGAY